MVTFPENDLFATVAVDQPVDGTYTYLVPAEMRRDVRAGVRVTVPLGRGNRMTAGTVMGVSEKGPETKEEVAVEGIISGETESLFEGGDFLVTPSAKGGMKAIAEVHREVAAVPVDLLELAKWISAYYCAPIGMTLATMVPAAVKRGSRLPMNVKVALVGGERGMEGILEGVKISPKTRKVFEGVYGFLKEGSKAEHEVMEFAGVGRPMVKRLVGLGLLGIEREIRLPDARVIGAGLEGVGEASRVIEKLSGDQETALADVKELLEKGEFGVRLLHGVTGSGKTEVYIRAIEKVVAAGKTAIVLVPEISLTPQAVRRFTARFPRVAILHSGMKDSERHQHWHAIESGWAQVVVGARSAIFAPAKNVGMIVVDEEHDSSYKQDNLPKYHGRDVAIRRAQMLGVPIVLGSATPAMESWQNAKLNPAWKLLSLTSRPLGMEMPRVVVVDMKGQSKERKGLHVLSTTLEHHLKQTLAAKKQAIFLLNRRGYAHYVMCPRCDWVLMCENCDATMVVHRKREEEESDAVRHARGLRGKVQCHYCLTAMILPTQCPLCQARLTHLGQGTQRAEDELLRKFPGLRLKRMDSDSMNSGADYQEALDAFGRGELDLLIGTQMISKGLDFPNVALVGVLNSDLAMTIPDFRAGERTFQLICQVAGRAGRAGGTGAGTVVVQTFQPNEPAIAFACQHDYLGFVNSELPHRKEFGYPPFGRLVRIVLSHKSWAKVHGAADGLKRLIVALTEKLGLPIRVQGPFPPPMERLVEMYRVEIILFAGTAGPLQRLVGSLRGRGVLMGGVVGVSVDVDPLMMM